MSPSSSCFSFETASAASPVRTVALVHLGSSRVEDTTYLGRLFSLSAQRLVELHLCPGFAVLVPDPAEPVAVPEALFAGRVLGHSIERDVLADDDLSHLGSPLWLAFVTCH